MERTLRVAYSLKLLHDTGLYSIAASFVHELGQASQETWNAIHAFLTDTLKVENGLSNYRFKAVEPGTVDQGIDIAGVMHDNVVQPLVEGAPAGTARDAGTAVESQDLAGLHSMIEGIKVQQAIDAVKTNNPLVQPDCDPKKYTYRQWIAIARGVARGTNVPVATIIDEIRGSTDIRPYIELAMSKDAPGDPAFFEAYATATRESLMYLIKTVGPLFGFRMGKGTVAIGMYSTGNEISKAIVVPSHKGMSNPNGVFATMLEHIGFNTKFSPRLTNEHVGTFKHYADLKGRGQNKFHAEPSLMQELFNAIAGGTGAIVAPVNVYLYSELWYCDGCLLEMPQLTLALKATDIDACIIAQQGERTFERWFAYAPQGEQSAIRSEFDKHLDRFEPGFAADYKNYIDQLFIALASARYRPGDAIRYVLDLLGGKHGAWTPGGSPTPFSEVVH